MEEKSWCFPGDICDFMEAQNSKEPRRRATAPTGREMRRSALARTACLITQSVRCGAEEMRGVVRCVFIFRCYIRSFCAKSAKATPTRAQCVNVQTRGSAAASCLRAEGAVHDVRPCASCGRRRKLHGWRLIPTPSLAPPAFRRVSTGLRNALLQLRSTVSSF